MQTTYWKDQINVLCVGQFFLIAAISMSVLFWPLFMEQLNVPASTLAWWSAAVYSAPLIAAIITGPLWGKLADKIGYKEMVLRAAIGLFITQACIGYVTNPIAIVNLRLLQGIFAGVTAASQAYAVSTTVAVSRGYAIGKLQSVTAIGALIGPLLGGLVAYYINYRAIFYVSAFICGLSTVYLFIFLRPIYSSHENLKPIESEHSSKKFIKTTIVYFLCLIVVAQVARFIFTPFFASFVIEELHGNDFHVGLLYSAAGVSIFLSATYWGKMFDRYREKQKSMHYVLVGLLLSASVLQLLMAYMTKIHGMMFLSLLWGFCLGGILPILFSLLLHVRDAKKQGGIVGLGQSANKLGELIGISLGAFSQEMFGFATSIQMIAALYLLLAIILLASKKLFDLKPRFA